MSGGLRIPGVLTRLAPTVEELPLVLDSPHSGSIYPADFKPAAPRRLLRLAEDFMVDRLFAAAPAHGAPLLAAEFPRSYIDPNREPGDLDPELLAEPWPGELSPGPKTALGVGLIWRLVGPGQPIYRRRLSRAEVMARLDGFYRPYHATLDQTLDRLQGRFGAAWHVNCHSMPSVAGPQSTDSGAARPDFCIGDLDGTTCEPEFRELIAAHLQSSGYEVTVNQPFKGAALVRRHGRPGSGRHSLQIEVNRRLYMDEARLRAGPGFHRLAEDLGRLVAAAAAYVRRRCPAPARGGVPTE